MFDSLIWLVPAAVLAAGLWRPHAGLLTLAATLPLFGVPPGGPYLAALDVAALAAIGTAWRAGPAPRSPADRPALAFVVVSLVSMIPPVYQPPSWQPRVLLGLLEVLPNVQSWSALYSWRAAATLLLGWLLYLAVRRAFAGRSSRPLGLALGAGLAPSLLLGLAARADLLELWAYRPIGGRLWDPRLHSLFFHSGWLAEFLVLAAPVAVAALLDRERRRRAAALALAAVTLVALTFTLQRGAWVAVGAQIVLVAFLYRRALTPDGPGLRRLAVGAGAALLAVSAVTVIQPRIVAPIQERLGEGPQLSGRWPVWEVTTTMIRERPLAGWGLGAFVPAFDQHDEGLAGAIHWLTPHNQYLMLATERGALGLAAFVWLAWALTQCLRRAIRTDDPTRRTIARGLVVAFVGFAVYGLVQYFFFLKMIEWLFWLLAGMAATLAPGRPSARFDRVAAGLALAAVLLVPWRLARTRPIASPTTASYGLHRPEVSAGKTFVWTERTAARRIAWEDEVLVLELANGHPLAGERPLGVTVSVDGRVRSRLTLRGGWEEHHIVLGEPRRPWIVVGLEATPAFRPFREFRRYPDLERSRDIRQLGVALGTVRWERSGLAGN